jgi:tetratricopeptide (TPR) repeat protein
VIVDHERHLRFEIQLHTEESARLADANHADYEIVRDRTRPLEQRQAAFDRMVHQFADVIHPPGIDGIGTPVRTARPVPEAEQIDPREEIIAHVRDVAEKMGARVVVTAPEYPALLRYLLDEGREQMSLGKYRTALREFDRLIAEFAHDLSPWSRRGVANAVVNSGIALSRIGRLDEALERFDRVISQEVEDSEVWQEATYAKTGRREAIERNARGE